MQPVGRVPALIIGLTGGVACGKTLAARGFAALGAPVLDADHVAREVVAAGMPAHREIVRAFGREFVQADGELDRRRLRETVFHDEVARHRLERITHPYIRERLSAWRGGRTEPYAVLSVPILLRSGMADLVHRILVIDAPPELQIARLTERDGIGGDLARRMLAAQESRDHRLARAHDVIRNTGTEDDLRAAVARLHAFYGDLARRRTFTAPGLNLP